MLQRLTWFSASDSQQISVLFLLHRYIIADIYTNFHKCYDLLSKINCWPLYDQWSIMPCHREKDYDQLLQLCFNVMYFLISLFTKFIGGFSSLLLVISFAAYAWFLSLVQGNRITSISVSNFPMQYLYLYYLNIELK